MQYKYLMITDIIAIFCGRKLQRCIMAYLSQFRIDILTVASGVTLLYCPDVQSPRVEVIMLIIPCILVLFRISCNFSALCSNFHTSLSTFSQDCCQNIPLTLKIMHNCNALTFSIRVLQYNPVV